MMSGTQSSVASGLPLVLPTNVKQPFAKLLVRSDQGQIVQQWLLLQNKCTLGSASACALRCQLPGIAAYHALLVIGAKQVFIRGLSPKLTRNGVATNELLLSESENTFEIAGHRFELVRNVQTQDAKSANTGSAPNSRMKFALARPLDLGQRRYEEPTAQSYPTPIPQVATSIAPPVAPSKLPPHRLAQHDSIQNDAVKHDSFQNDSAMPGAVNNTTKTTSQPDSSWINELVQNAIQPFEQQIQSLLAPLAAVQAELENRSSLNRKNKSRRAKSNPDSRVKASTSTANVPPANTSPANTSPASVATASAASVETAVAHQPKHPPVESAPAAFDSQTIVRSFDPSQHGFSSLPMDSIVVLAPHLAKAPEVSESVQPDQLAPAASFEVPVAKPEPASAEEHKVSDALEAMIGKQFASLEILSERLNDVSSQLGALERIVSENLAAPPAPSVADIKPSASDEAISRLTSVTERLNELMQELQTRQVALESTDHTWRESLNGKLAQLHQRIDASEVTRAAAVPSASEEALERIATVTERLSGLMEELQSRQATLESSDQQWRTRLLEQMNQLQERITSTELTVQNLSQLPPVVRYVAEPAPAAQAPLPLNLSEKLDLSEKLEPAGQAAIMAQAMKPFTPEPIAVESKIEPNKAVEEQSAVFVTEAISTLPEWQVGPRSATVEELISESNIQHSSDELLEHSINDHEVAAQTNQEFDSIAAPSTTHGPAQTPPVPADMERVAPELPSWWTDDDKSQYADDVSDSARRASQISYPREPSQSLMAEPAYNDHISEWELPRPSIEHSSIEPPQPPTFNASAVNVQASVEEVKQSISSPASWEIPSGSASLPADAVQAEDSSNPLVDTTEARELAAILEKFGVPAAEAHPTNELGESQESQPALPLESARRSAGTDLPTTDQHDLDPIERVNAPMTRDELDIVDELAVENGLEPLPLQTADSNSEGVEAVVEDEEESIEDYMKRLMARMRGESEPSLPAAEPKLAAAPQNNPPTRDPASVKLPARKSELFLPETKTHAPATTSSFNPEDYVPKLAPEKSTTMAAMRELANTSARSAIQVSTRRRHGTALAIKIAVASTGFIAGLVLVMINGFNVNIALIATFACFLVALIWGFDAAGTLKPLFDESGAPTAPQAAARNPAIEE